MLNNLTSVYTYDVIQGNSISFEWLIVLQTHHTYLCILKLNLKPKTI